MPKTKSSGKEFLKDVSAFANHNGGHIFLGISEEQGVPSEIYGIGADPDKEIQRLHQIALSGVEPRIPALQMKSIIIDEKRVLIIRISRSEIRPHQVVAYGTNRFFGRNSAGVHQLSIEELRTIFNRNLQLETRVEAFRRKRLEKIEIFNTPIPLTDKDGIVVIHIIPLQTAFQNTAIDLISAKERHLFIPPHVVGGFSHNFNINGSVVFDNFPDTYGYTQTFRDGRIEIAYASIIQHESPGTIYSPTS